jgi:glycosyltransferase involved in cell wall biosynthesis
MITLITTYFEDPYRLTRYIEEEFNEEVFDEFIIVDDGSPRQPAYDIVKNYPMKNISLFRVKDDIGFNSHGARNLAMQHVDTEWAYMVDIDRKDIFDYSKILQRYCLTAADNEYFISHVEHKGVVTHNDYCVKTKSWWTTGGYDEEFTNYHYGDRIFIDRLNMFLKPTTIPYCIKSTRPARKFKYYDGGITVYPDDNTILHPRVDKGELQEIIDKVGMRNDNPNLWRRDNIIQFEWEQLI